MTSHIPCGVLKCVCQRVPLMMSRIYPLSCHNVCTVEPLNKDTSGTRRFVLCREVVLSVAIFYRVCIQEYIHLVLYWEVVLFRSILYQRFHCTCALRALLVW